MFLVTADGIKRRFVRNPEGKQPFMTYDNPEEQFDDSKFIPALTKKGAVYLSKSNVRCRWTVISRIS